LKQLHLLRSKRDNDSNTIAIIRVYVYVIVPRRACLWKWDFKIFRIIRYRIVPRSLRASKWFRSEVIVSETIEQAIVRNCSTVLYTKLTYRPCLLVLYAEWSFRYGGFCRKASLPTDEVIVFNREVQMQYICGICNTQQNRWYVPSS